MKRISTGFLKVILSLVALVVAIAMIWSPLREGRAAHLDLLHIYADPLILYSYVAAIPFFFGLFQAFKLLQYIETNKAFTPSAVLCLKRIKYASLLLIAFIFGALIFIRFFAHGGDPAGPTSLGILISLGELVIATAAAIFQKLLQNAVEMKAEHDLTV